MERPETRNAQVERMLGSFQLNLFVLSLIALFVGVFLVYNTMSVSVVRRRREIGILRGLGVSRGGILLIVCGEGALIGLIGSALGVLLGRGPRRHHAGDGQPNRVVALRLRSARRRRRCPAALILQAILLGCGTALCSSLLPALEATAAPPGANLAPAARERRPRPWRLAVLGMTLLAVSYLLTTLGPIDGRPLFGYGACLALLLGVTFLCPAMLISLQRPLAASLARTGSLGPRLAVGSLGRALRRNAVTISAMTIGLAMLVSVSTMIHSFRKTVEVWIEQTIRADLYLSHVGRAVRGADARLPAALLEQVRQVPGVALADGYRTLRMEDGQGGRFALGAGDFEIMARTGTVPGAARGLRADPDTGQGARPGARLRDVCRTLSPSRGGRGRPAIARRDGASSHCRGLLRLYDGGRPGGHGPGAFRKTVARPLDQLGDHLSHPGGRSAGRPPGYPGTASRAGTI